eukprot:418814_1
MAMNLVVNIMQRTGRNIVNKSRKRGPIKLRFSIRSYANKSLFAERARKGRGYYCATTVAYKSSRFSSSSTFNLQNKVAIITGAGSGIGRATAKLFHSYNATVIGIDINEEMLSTLKTELGNNNMETYVADVCDYNQVKSYTDNIFNKYGKINILCNIAGGAAGMDEFGPFHTRKISHIKGTIDMNLWGVINNCHTVIGYMLQTIQNDKTDKNGNDSPCIINLASVAGLQGMPYLSDYIISKHGVNGMTKAITADYSASGIRCNSVCPYYILTPLVDRPAMIEALKETLPITTPAQRFGDTEEVANLCLYLASDQSKFVTGSMLVIDGGTNATVNHAPSMIQIP